METLIKSDFIRKQEPIAQHVDIVEDDTKFNVAEEENSERENKNKIYLHL